MEVPEGRLKMVAFVGSMTVSAVPLGLKKGDVLFPPLKRWAIISRPSGTSATGISSIDFNTPILRPNQPVIYQPRAKP